jgi:hypothetical protein
VGSPKLGTYCKAKIYSFLTAKPTPILQEIKKVSDNDVKTYYSEIGTDIQRVLSGL